MNNITKNTLFSLLKGEFFSVDFIKEDGSVRHLSGRLNVRKYIKGTGKPAPEDSILLYVPAIKQYRSFKINRLKQIKCGKIEILGEAG